MNFKSILLLSILFFGACNNANQQKEAAGSKNLNIKGSDTVLPLAQKSAEQYMKTHTDQSIAVVGGGSGTGITALMVGNTDIAMSSRDIKGEEKLKFQEKQIQIEVKTIAVDALAVIVHPENKVEQLTREQLEKIFTPFYRVDPSREKKTGGYGLGLAIAARAVKLHHGEIRARRRLQGHHLPA